MNTSSDSGLEVITANSIKGGLNSFHTTFNSLYPGANLTDVDEPILSDPGENSRPPFVQG